VAISVAVQHNGRVDVYNEKNKLVGSHLGKLQSYTNSTVSIKRGGRIDTYDESGMQISSSHAP
jgi:hypothetical protein